MERDRVHRIHHVVSDNTHSLMKSGYFNYLTREYTRPIVYTDRWPSFKVSGANSEDATVVNHGLSVGGGYAIRVGNRIMRGRHQGKNE